MRRIPGRIKTIGSAAKGSSTLRCLSVARSRIFVLNRHQSRLLGTTGDARRKKARHFRKKSTHRCIRLAKTALIHGHGLAIPCFTRRATNLRRCRAPRPTSIHAPGSGSPAFHDHISRTPSSHHLGVSWTRYPPQADTPAVSAHAFSRMRPPCLLLGQSRSSSGCRRPTFSRARQVYQRTVTGQADQACNNEMVSQTPIEKQALLTRFVMIIKITRRYNVFAY